MTKAIEDIAFMGSTSFGEFIKKERKEKGYSRKSFADLLGVSVSTLASWEMGERSAPLKQPDVMKKMVEYLDIYDVEEFVGKAIASMGWDLTYLLS